LLDAALQTGPSFRKGAVVERFFTWLGRNRRLARDFEATIASATAFLYAAAVLLLIRTLARS
jgi:putative transposase